MREVYCTAVTDIRHTASELDGGGNRKVLIQVSFALRSSSSECYREQGCSLSLLISHVIGFLTEVKTHTGTTANDHVCSQRYVNVKHFLLNLPNVPLNVSHLKPPK